jgi:hypothetical protein
MRFDVLRLCHTFMKSSSAGLYLDLADEQGEPYRSDRACLHDVSARVRLHAPTPDIPHWRIDGLTAPNSVAERSAPLFVFKVSAGGSPLPQLTFALKLVAVACPPAKWVLVVSDAATQHPVQRAAMRARLELRLWRADDLDNVVPEPVPIPQELPVVALAAQPSVALAAALSDGARVPAALDGSVEVQLPAPGSGVEFVLSQFGW